MRSTKQRSEIAELLASTNSFQTAQEIHGELLSRGSGIGLATVYRTLSALAERGEIDVVAGAGGETRYRWCSSQHHHHLSCSTCGRTVEISVDAIETLCDGIARAHGFRDVQHTLEIVGTCQHCT